jgi:hypothetical protein
MIVLLIAVAWITLLSLITGLCAIARLGDRGESASAGTRWRSERVPQPAWEPPAATFSAAERALAAQREGSSREFLPARGSVAA